MRYAEMQEAGEHYVCADFSSILAPSEIAGLGRELCHQHLSSQSARLVLIGLSGRADAQVYLFNANGTEAVDGNGVCCAAKYVYDKGLTRKPRLTIETGQEFLTADLEIEDGCVKRVRIDFGSPVVHPPVEMPMAFPDTTINLTRVTLGQEMQSVIFFHDLMDPLVESIALKLEKHPFFAQGANVIFVKVNRRDDVRARVWRRSAGEVMACPRGAGAIVIGGTLSGRVQRQLTVHMRGGDLMVDWSHDDDDHVYVTVPVVEQCQGEWTKE